MISSAPVSKSATSMLRNTSRSAFARLVRVVCSPLQDMLAFDWSILARIGFVVLSNNTRPLAKDLMLVSVVFKLELAICSISSSLSSSVSLSCTLSDASSACSESVVDCNSENFSLIFSVSISNSSLFCLYASFSWLASSI